MKLIHGAVSLKPSEPELRAQLRDVAVKLLVQRDTETGPNLPTGRARSLVFGSTGQRLAVLSDDGAELAFWDMTTERRLWTLSLRAGSSSRVVVAVPVAVADPRPGDALDGGSSALNVTRGNAARRRSPFPRLAYSGHSLVVVWPDGRGFGLIDPLSGTTLRPVNRPTDREVLGLVADPAGRRIVTIERIIDPVVEAMEGAVPWDISDPTEYEVNLWDLDRLDEPMTALNWYRAGFGGRPGNGPPNHGPNASNAPTTDPQQSRGRPPTPPPLPLVAISPEGKVVATGSWGTPFVRLFSAADGRELTRPAPTTSMGSPSQRGSRACGR